MSSAKSQTDPSPDFPEWIKDDLTKSGLSSQLIQEMGVTPVKDKDHLKSLIGFAFEDSQSILQASNAYVIPYPDGEYNRVKLRFPIKGVKYFSPAKEKESDAFRFYYLPAEASKLKKPGGFLIFTEGEKKTAKLTNEIRNIDMNSTAVGFSGVTMWRKCPWDMIRLKDRQIYIAFDSDMAVNHDVFNQTISLFLFLRKHGAIVKVLAWNQEYKGIDDYLVSQKAPTIALRNLMDAAVYNPFALSQMSTNSLLSIAKSLGYSKVQVKELFSTFDLESEFNIDLEIFLELFQDAVKKDKAQEKAKKQETATKYYEHDNKTYVPGDFAEVEVAGFTMEFMTKIEDTDGHVSYVCQIQSAMEKKTVDIPSKLLLASPASFRDTITQYGLFRYNITDIFGHNRFMAYLEAKRTIPHKKKSQYIGMLEGCFLGHDYVVSENGVKIPIQDSGYIAPKDGKKIMIGKGEASAFCNTLQKIQTILETQAWKLIGFTVASLFSRPIIQEFGFFPLLFLYGKHETGKSAMAEWCKAMFGAHRIENFNINSTQKAFQRACAKYCGIPIFLNEYRSNEPNNTLLCSLYDREGYGRAKKDNTLDIDQMEVNATLGVISTQNIIGTKAEDVISRVVQIDTNESKYNEESFLFLQENMEQFSYFVSYCLEQINPTVLLESIRVEIKAIRQEMKGYKDRIVKNHAIISSAYNILVEAVQRSFGQTCLKNVDSILIIDGIYKQQDSTKASDLGMTFLTTLTAMVRNKRIESDIAKIDQTEEEEILVFSLRDSLPFVRAQGKLSEVGISDEKTIGSSLKLLGATSHRGFDLGQHKLTVWMWKIQY